MKARRKSRKGAGLCLAAVAIAAAWSGAASGQGVLSAIAGPPGAQMGGVVAAADFDGDGVRDVLLVEATGSTVTVDLRSGRTGQLIHQFPAPPGSNNFGATYSGNGDVNGDGLADVLIGAPAFYGGIVYVYSGAGFSLIRTHVSSGPAQYGTRVEILGDVNADGGDDYAVATHIFVRTVFFEYELGTVDVFSGRDGQKLVTLTGEQDTSFAYSILGLGDVTGDAVPDLSVGKPLASSGGWTQNGEVRTFSGSNWSFVSTVAGTGYAAVTGFALAAVGDQDGDGYGDIAATWSPLQDLGWLSGALIGSPALGTVLGTASGNFQAESTAGGRSIAAIPDVDGDGRDEVLFVDGDETQGRLVMANLAGQHLFETTLDSPGGYVFGRSVASLGDTTGDGHPEFVVGDPYAEVTAGQKNGMLWTYTTQPLLAVPATLSVTMPGTVEFTLSPGAPHAGATYILLASATPESASCGGFDVGSAHVPFCPDGVMLASALLANTSTLQSTIGVLDGASGQGSAKLDITGVHIPGAAVGAHIHFFFLTKPSGAGWDKAWPAATVEIVP